MFDFNKPNIEITDVSEDKKYGRFVVRSMEDLSWNRWREDTVQHLETP